MFHFPQMHSSNPIFCPPRMQSSLSSGSDESYSSSSSLAPFGHQDGYSSSYTDSEHSFVQSPVDYSALQYEYGLSDYGSYLDPSAPLIASTPGHASDSALLFETDDFQAPSFLAQPQPLPLPPQQQQQQPQQQPQQQWPQAIETACASPYVDLAQAARSVPPATRPAKSFVCDNCGRSFTRFADLKRHHSSVHYPVPKDCPVEDCVRKGDNGFPRRDHLTEHLRSYHHLNLPKRTGLKMHGAK